MHTRLHWSVALALLGLVAPVRGEDVTPAEPAGNTLEWTAREATRLGERLPDFPEDLEVWKQRREEVRRALAEDVLGLPEREPMRAGISETRTEDGLRFERVHYLWADETYGSGMVVRPDQHDCPMAAVVQPPGWVEGWDAARDRRDIAVHLARRGFLVLVIDDPRVGPRQAPHAAIYHTANAVGTPAMGIQVFDALRALDYLLTRRDVDPGRIGVSGLCQGSEQTWLAAALDERFQNAIPVCGTTNYEHWVRMPTDLGISLSDPSPYIWRVLEHTDWHEIDACIAPRPVLIVSNSGDNWWPVPGYEKVVETLESVFALYGAPEKFRHVRRLETHNFMPFVAEITDWHVRYLLAALDPSADASRASCEPAPEAPSFSMLDWLAGRLEEQGNLLPRRFEAADDWDAASSAMLAHLRELAALGRRQPAPLEDSPQVCEQPPEGLVEEIVRISVDADLVAPARLVRPELVTGRRPAVVLSHDGALNPSAAHMMADALTTAARHLAWRGWIVIIPEHTSASPDSSRFVGAGRSLSDLYGCADTVGVPPLALRMWDDLAALEFLLGRDDIDPACVFAAGVGVGGVDAMLSAAADPRFAGAANVGGVTTLPAWAQGIREVHNYEQVEPYLPGLAPVADLDLLAAAVSPRPLVLAQALDAGRWPLSGWEQSVATTRHIYGLRESALRLIALDAAARDGIKAMKTGRDVPTRRALELAEALIDPKGPPQIADPDADDGAGGEQ